MSWRRVAALAAGTLVVAAVGAAVAIGCIIDAIEKADA